MARELVARSTRRITSPFRNYFNHQFEATKDEVRLQAASQALNQTSVVVAALEAQSARLDAMVERIDGLTQALDDLRTTHDQLLAVVAEVAKRPDGPPPS